MALAFRYGAYPEYGWVSFSREVEDLLAGETFPMLMSDILREPKQLAFSAAGWPDHKLRESI